jgi:haloacetate dehalogenase
VSGWAGFRTLRLPGARADVAIHARVGGDGAPLLLLHGYPQTHEAWRLVAPRLTDRFTVVAADLRGYGDSSAPADDPAHDTYSKRAMGADMVAAMAALGFPRFHVAGHDRGGRVAYRLALDRPEVVERLAVLEIAPTVAMWEAFDARLAHRAYHWTFLAQPAPLPERLIGGDPTFHLEHTLRGWTKAKALEVFGAALPRYRAAFAQPARIAAFCADYRAGFGPDRAADEADRAAGRAIAAPTLLVAGTGGFPAATGDPAAHWRAFAPDLTVATVDCGHFPMEEDPDATTAALRAHFGSR